MADPEAITIPLCLPSDEAMALAQLAKRIGYEDLIRYSNRHELYGKRLEIDVMWSAVNIVQRQLAEAGFAPR
jgi:hypothetical protein